MLCLHSPYNDDSLGHGHDTYVFGGYIRAPPPVRDSTFILYYLLSHLV